MTCTIKKPVHLSRKSLFPIGFNTFTDGCSNCGIDSIKSAEDQMHWTVPVVSV